MSDFIGPPSYTNLTSCTLVPEPNSTYLSHTSGTPVIADPMSGPTVGLLMLLSTFQYEAPYVNPAYSTAAAEAGKAAYMQSGGQKMEDNLKGYGSGKATDIAHNIGLTDTEMGIVLGSAKVYRNKQIDLRGPRLGPIKTTLTGTENSGSIGFKWEW